MELNELLKTMELILTQPPNPNPDQFTCNHMVNPSFSALISSDVWPYKVNTFFNDLRIFRMEIKNASTTSSKSSQLRNINTVRLENRSIATQPGEIAYRKSKVTAFFVNPGVNITAIYVPSLPFDNFAHFRWNFIVMHRSYVFYVCAKKKPGHIPMYSNHLVKVVLFTITICCVHVYVPMFSKTR